VLPQRFDQAKPFLTLGIVLLAWLLIPTALKRMARTSFFELQAPLETTASYIRDLQDFWSLKTRPKNDLIEAGRDLAPTKSAFSRTPPCATNSNDSNASSSFPLRPATAPSPPAW
jgi:rod shape-determining protein MreC